jgi:Flp pilus assembly protein TadD
MDVRQRTRIFAFFALLLCLVQLFPLEAQSRRPPRNGAHEIYGRTLLERGDHEGAIKELETALGISIDLPEAHFSLARAYTKANRPADAERERQLFLRLTK